MSTGLDGVFIPEVRKHRENHARLVRVTYSSTKAAGVMLLAAIVALIVANTGLHEPFRAFWETDFGFVFGEREAVLTLSEIINDIFMAVFFLLVGLEIKYEMTAGELTNIRQAILPIVAAFGGVLAPIVVFTLINGGNPESAGGWGVPTATDIAFALGIISLLGNRVPNGVRVFLSTLAVADDIIAIVVIAVFYGQTPSAFWLVCAGVVLLALVALNRAHVYSITPYMLIGVVLWYCVFRSGVHSTIAGVLLAMTIPAGTSVDLRSFIDWSGKTVERAKSTYDEGVHISAQDDYLKVIGGLSSVSRQVVPPSTRLEHTLYPWVYFGVLPLFALTNADVTLVGTNLATLVSTPAFTGVFFGLLLGKPIGIMLFSFIVIKLKVASLPEHTTWRHMFGAAVLGGVGFTMAIFVANLAFTDAALIADAKAGILSASALAGILGFTLLALEARRDQKRGVAYVTATGENKLRSTADAETARESDRLISAYADDKVRGEYAAAQKASGSQEIEIVVHFGERAPRKRKK